MPTDKIFAPRMEEIRKFVFDERVASVFDDMVTRSVPQYDEVQRAGACLAAKAYQSGTYIVDLGCSTGTTLIACAAAIRGGGPQANPLLVGVDSSAPMLAQCREKLRSAEVQAELIQADIAEYQPPPASVVTMNYTLQFLPKTERPGVLKRISRALVPGGVFVLTEKVHAKDQAIEEMITALYYDFKRCNRYSDLEIAQKREALENVLQPLSLEENHKLLTEAGFRAVELYLKWFGFATFIAR